MISGKWGAGLLLAISLLGGSISHLRAEDTRGPAPVLVGTWESQTSGNAYRMSVAWNPVAGRYEGRLVAQGHASQNVGFPLGELCWTATPSGNPTTLNIFEEFRSGRVGLTSNVTWRQGLLYLDRSTTGQLLTSIEAFRRVAETTSGGTTSGAPSFANLAMFPSADQVRQRISGRDPLDTAARQFAALKTLANILNGVGVANQDERRGSYAIYHTYSEGQGLARRQFGTAGEPLAQSYLNDEQFTHDITHVVFPDVGKYVDAKAKVIAAAQAAARDDAEQKAAVRAAAKERAEADEAAAAAAEEAAQHVEVRLQGAWSGVPTYVTGLYDCKEVSPRPARFLLTQEGRTVRAITVDANACVPAKSVLWEGQLDRDKVTVGDLPISFEIQMFAAAKGGKRSKLSQKMTMQISSASDLWIEALEFVFLLGDHRKDLATNRATLLARRRQKPAVVDASAPGFNVDAYMRDNSARMERERRFNEDQARMTQQQNYERQKDQWNDGRCADCGGVAPIQPND
jgi:hypothetical protein